MATRMDSTKIMFASCFSNELWKNACLLTASNLFFCILSRLGLKDVEVINFVSDEYDEIEFACGCAMSRLNLAKSHDKLVNFCICKSVENRFSGD